MESAPVFATRHREEREMVKRIRHTGSFVAVGENGAKRTIHIFTDIIDARHQKDLHAELEGLKQLRTASGDAVNRLAKGEYEVVVTGEVLRSDDPNAL